MKMLKEKNYKKFVLLLISLVLVLFYPLKTHAIFGISEDLWGYLEMALDALDMWDTTMLNYLWRILILLIASYGFTVIAAGIFDWAMNLPINLGVANPNNNLVVWYGWNFCRDIANILIILILAIIAITYILRIQTFGGRKALVTLIIVALLINFSLLFVGAAVDITNIIMHGIISSLGGASLTTLVNNTLGPAFAASIYYYTIWFLGYLGAALVPIGNVAYIVIGISFIITSLFLGWILFTFVLIILGFVLGFITLFIGIMFMFRVAIIWILAILSPMAFLCWILPQTKRYWDDWLNLLTQWLVWGILAVFFVGLGIKLAGALPKPSLAITLFGIQVAAPPVVQYLFLIVYFGVVYYFVLKRYTPEMASFLIGAAKGIVAMGAPIVAAPFAKGYQRFLAEQRKREEKLKEKEEKGEKLTRREKLQRFGGKVLTLPGSFYYKMRGTTPEIERRKMINEEKKKMEDLSTASLRKTLANPLASREKKVAAMEILAERGKLRDEDKEHLSSFEMQGGDIGKILNARPDWAPLVGKEIREQAEKMKTGDVLYTQPEALENIEFLASLDVHKISTLETKGSEAQKEAIRKAMLKKEEISRKLTKLKEDYDNLQRSPTAKAEEKEKARERYLRAKEVFERITASPVFNLEKKEEKIREMAKSKTPSDKGTPPYIM